MTFESQPRKTQAELVVLQIQTAIQAATLCRAEGAWEMANATISDSSLGAFTYSPTNQTS